MDGLTGQALPGRVGLSAPAMAAAVSLDPQFTLPVRPRLLAHLVLVDLGDGLLVEGTAERQVLRGHAATDLLPALLPLLDGTRRIDDLAGALDRPGRQVHAAVALLYACGLLEDADDRAPRPVAVPAEAAAFLGRHLDTTRVDRSVGAALARLATARVVVVGPAGAEAVAGALRRAGVPQATAAGHGGWRHALAAAATDGIDLVLALGAPDPLPRELDDWCAQARVPWLRSAHGSAGVEIGPRFEAGLTACYRCFAEELPAGGRGRPGARRRAAWHGLVVDEVLALLSRVLVARSTGGVTTVDLDGWSDRTVLVPRRPGCPRCCPDGGTARREPELAHRYEQAVAFPPRHLLDPRTTSTTTGRPTSPCRRWPRSTRPPATSRWPTRTGPRSRRAPSPTCWRPGTRRRRPCSTRRCSPACCCGWAAGARTPPEGTGAGGRCSGGPPPAATSARCSCTCSPPASTGSHPAGGSTSPPGTAWRWCAAARTPPATGPAAWWARPRRRAGPPRRSSRAGSSAGTPRRLRRP